MRSWIGIAAMVAFGVAIVLANVLTSTFGFVPVGFGLEATAGTYMAGVVLALRDVIQDTCGRWALAGVIAAGVVVSFVLADPFIAVASAVAFLFSEIADLVVYTPLRARARFGDRRWAVAVGASNVVGAIVDTVLFVGIAFGAAAIAPALPGQLLGKVWATLAFLMIGWAVGRAVFRESEHSGRA